MLSQNVECVHCRSLQQLDMMMETMGSVGYGISFFDHHNIQPQLPLMVRAAFKYALVFSSMFVGQPGWNI